MRNSIPQNPDIVGVGGVFNRALVTSLARANPDLIALLVARRKNGLSANERVECFFDAKIAAIENPEDRMAARKSIQLPDNVIIIDLEDFLSNFRGKIGRLFMPVLPSATMRDGLIDIRDSVGLQAFDSCQVLSASKGMAIKSDNDCEEPKMIHEVIEEILNIRDRVIVMLGGNLAFDVATGDPMMTEIAGETKNLELISKLFKNSNLRAYLSLDKRILDIAGVIKNVIAVVAGMATVAFGKSTFATVGTRGLAEYRRIASVVRFSSPNEQKSEAERVNTLYKLGKSVVIPNSGGVESDFFLFPGTRNFAAGQELAKLLQKETPVNQAIAEITKGKTIEGISSAIPLRNFIRNLGIEAPIIEIVAKILEGEMSMEEATKKLMGREMKSILKVS